MDWSLQGSEEAGEILPILLMLPREVGVEEAKSVIGTCLKRILPSGDVHYHHVGYRGGSVTKNLDHLKMDPLVQTFSDLGPKIWTRGSIYF